MNNLKKPKVAFSDVNKIRYVLCKKLIARKVFWSYNLSVDFAIQDDVLIEKTLVYLDIEDINNLFRIFAIKKIKQVWRERVVIQGEYLDRLNNLLAWMYFDIKNPHSYLKRTISQHIQQFS